MPARQTVVIGNLPKTPGAETAVAEITGQRIAQYEKDRVGEAARRERRLTPSTINRELAILRHMLRLAEEWGYLAKVPRIRLAPEPEGRLRFLTEEEIPKLFTACARSRNPYLSAIVTLALNTGMRKGEILGLTWDRVDAKRRVLLLEHTKSGKRREIPMNRAVAEPLEALRGRAEMALVERGADPGDASEDLRGLVFARAAGKAWGNIRTAFETACERAGVTKFHFHDLRHTCASWLIMRGRSLTEVRDLLGHRELSTTLRYAHLAPERLRDAVATLEYVEGT
jgi:integrase